jgi:hypothetical protein
LTREQVDGVNTQKLAYIYLGLLYGKKVSSFLYYSCAHTHESYILIKTYYYQPNYNRGIMIVIKNNMYKKVRMSRSALVSCATTDLKFPLPGKYHQNGAVFIL